MEVTGNEPHEVGIALLEGTALKEHTLNRLGHGMSQWHATRYDEIGFNAYVDEQLGGSLPALRQTASTPEAKLQRAVSERRQLEVMLLDFWFNHFNVDASGGIAKDTVDLHDRAILPHVLGDFSDMLLATAKSPAMLDYLDNRLNVRERVTKTRTYGLNENYAREVMELHTLGIDGGYTEDDVREVARILTGWGTSRQSKRFEFSANRHDDGQKTALGVTFPAGKGEAEGIELLAMLANHGSTASFVGRKLCRRLVAESPSQATIDVAAGAFRESKGDLGAVTAAVLKSSHFLDEQNFRTKMKPPLRYMASAMLAMGATTAADISGLMGRAKVTLEGMGEEPYRAAPPTGYPESSGYWVSSSSMVGRFTVSGKIAADGTLRNRLKSAAGVDGADVAETVDRIAATMCPGGVSSATRAAAISYTTEQADSNDGRITSAAHVILSSPEFVRF